MKDGAAQMSIVEATELAEHFSDGRVTNNALAIDEDVVVVGNIVGRRIQSTPIAKSRESDASEIDETLQLDGVTIPKIERQHTQPSRAVVLPDAFHGRPGRAALNSPIAYEGQKHGIASEFRQGEGNTGKILKGEVRSRLARHERMSRSCRRRHDHKGRHRETEASHLGTSRSGDHGSSGCSGRLQVLGPNPAIKAGPAAAKALAR